MKLCKELFFYFFKDTVAFKICFALLFHLRMRQKFRQRYADSIDKKQKNKKVLIWLEIIRNIELRDRGSGGIGIGHVPPSPSTLKKKKKKLSSKKKNYKIFCYWPLARIFFFFSITSSTGRFDLIWKDSSSLSKLFSLIFYG
jgi:hypothetical protein